MDLNDILKHSKEEFKVISIYKNRFELFSKLRTTGELEKVSQIMFFELMKMKEVNTVNEDYGLLLNSWQQWRTDVISLAFGFDKSEDQSQSSQAEIIEIVRKNFNSKSDGVIEDIVIILNWMGHAILDCYNQQQTNAQSELLSGSEGNASAGANIENVSLRHKETDILYAAYRLGGGTLGEIIKVNKARMNNSNLSFSQVNKASHLLNISQLLCDPIKTANTIPKAMHNRDNGGMYFLHESLVQYANEVANIIAVHYRSISKMDERNVIKNTMNLLKCNETLKEMFYSAVSSIKDFEKCCFPQEVLEEFRNVHLRKMGHALLNDIILAKCDKKNRKNKDRGQGGQLLRDQLYTISSGSKKVEKSKTKSANKRKTSDPIQTKINSKQTISVKTASKEEKSVLKQTLKKRKLFQNDDDPVEKVTPKLILKKPNLFENENDEDQIKIVTSSVKKDAKEQKRLSNSVLKKLNVFENDSQKDLVKAVAKEKKSLSKSKKRNVFDNDNLEDLAKIVKTAPKEKKCLSKPTCKKICDKTYPLKDDQICENTSTRGRIRKKKFNNDFVY